VNIVPPLPFIGPVGMQSVVVSPAILGDADGLRLAAVRLESAAVDLDGTVNQLRNTVFQLTAGGDWTGEAADAFAHAMVEPVALTLSGVAGELERIAAAVRLLSKQSRRRWITTSRTSPHGWRLGSPNFSVSGVRRISRLARYSPE
jgi:hypothetical protein